eukprot:m.90476 g.90476  ORF g.90476 m.90476 type:complete len:166 (+) comp8850_c1_seq25:1063-1560(+)
MRCNYGSLGWGFHFLFNNNIHHGGHCSKGTTYIIRNLDMDARIAHAEQLEVDYYTHPQDLSNIDPIHRLLFPASQPHRWGAVQVMMKVYGYRKIRRRTLETFEVVPLPSKTLEYVTKGLWFDIDPIVKVFQITLCFCKKLRICMYSTMVLLFVQQDMKKPSVTAL